MGRISCWAALFLCIFPHLCPAAFAVEPVPSQGNEGDAPQEIHLTLDDAINLAIQSNRSIKGSQNNLTVQQLNLVSAESEFDVKVYPKGMVGAAGSGLNSNEVLGLGVDVRKRTETGSVISLSPSVRNDGGLYQKSVILSLEVPLFRGSDKETSMNAVWGANYSVRSAQRNAYKTKVNTVVATVSAVYNALRQEYNLKKGEELAARLQKHALTAEAKENLGLANPMDIYRANIQMKDAQFSLTRSREAYQAALDEVKTLICLPLKYEVIVSAPMQYDMDALDEQGALKAAFNNRVEFEQMDDDLAESMRKTKVAQNNVQPSLNLSMQYLRSENANPLDSNAVINRDAWSVQLASTTDFARTAEKAAYQQSLLAHNDMQLKAADVENNVTKEVRAELRNLFDSRKRIDNRLDQIKEAEGKLELAQLKFNYDMADNFDLIQAEVELKGAQIDLNDAKTDYIIGTYKLKGVLGTLIAREKGEF